MRQELVIHDAKLEAKLDRLGRAAKRAHDRVRDCAIKAVENMVRSGQSLCKARDLCDTDQWDDFLAKYFNRAHRTALTYMKLARSWPALQAVAPPEALTSQRKALRILNSLVLGDEPQRKATTQRRKRPRKTDPLELRAPSASTEITNDERATYLRRIYSQMLGILTGITKDLSDVTPSTYYVRNAIDCIRRAQNDLVAHGQKLFATEATATQGTDTMVLPASSQPPLQNAQDTIFSGSDDVP